MKLAAVALPSSLPGHGGLGRSEPLVLPVEAQGDVPRLAVPALQVLQDETGRGSLFPAIGYQDEGVVGPILKLAGFAEARQVEPIGVARPPLGIYGASEGRNEDDRNPGIGELSKTAHRGIDRPSPVGVLAMSPDSLDVVKQEQVGLEGKRLGMTEAARISHLEAVESLISGQMPNGSRAEFTLEGKERDRVRQEIMLFRGWECEE